MSGSSSSINNRDRDEPYLILVMSNRTLSSVRSDLGHAFLYVSTSSLFFKSNLLLDLRPLAMSLTSDKCMKL